MQRLPADRPRVVSGLGTPEEVLEAVAQVSCTDRAVVTWVESGVLIEQDPSGIGPSLDGYCVNKSLFIHPSPVSARCRGSTSLTWASSQR